MGGVMVVVFGVFKVGKIMKLVGKRVMVGFRAGMAVLIFWEEIGDFVGVGDMEKDERFMVKIGEIGKKMGRVNL